MKDMEMDGTLFEISNIPSIVLSLLLVTLKEYSLF